MTHILKDPGKEAGWKLFLSIPRLILRYTRGGPFAFRQARATFQDFLNFMWDRLLHLQGAASDKPSRKVSDTLKRQRAAIQLVKYGEFSRAAKLLTSSPDLAPVTSETASNWQGSILSESPFQTTYMYVNPSASPGHRSSPHYQRCQKDQDAVLQVGNTSI